MSLPSSRPRTYVPGMPLIPDDVNELFDAVIDAKLDLTTVPIDVFGLVTAITGSAPTSIVHGLSTQNSADIAAAAQPVGSKLPLGNFLNGTRIVNVRLYLKDVAGQPALKVSLMGGNRAGAAAPNAVTGVSLATGAVQTVELQNLNHIVGVTTLGPAHLLIQTLTNATGAYSIYAAEADIDRL